MIKMKKTKKACAIILTLVMAFSASSYTYADDQTSDKDKLETILEANRSDDSRVNGLHRVHKDTYKVSETKSTKKALRKAAQVFPAKYRSDEQPWAEGVRVKNQKRTGLCWAFAVTTAAEYSWAKESYEKYGAIKEVSPGHLGYFYYNRVNDPLGNTAGDKNLVGDDAGWPLAGGDHITAMQHLATYSGVGLESNTPFDLINSHIINDKWDDSYKPYSNSSAYDNYVTVQDSYIHLNTIKVDEIKNLVYNYGALATAVTFDYHNYMNLEERDSAGKLYKDGRSFYNFMENESNHGVTIIGWDDDYPASNFTHTISGMSDSEARELTTPSRDGAWIVQNSWGEDEHESGVFYMSYDSVDMNEYAEALAFDMQEAEKYDYNFQYDGTADCGDSSDPGNERFYTNRGSSAANLYTNTTGSPIQLEAVGFTTYNEGESDYNISVYKNVTDSSNPTSGRFAGSSTTTTDIPGTKTAVLSNPVPIDVGETYSIVFSFPDDNAFGVEKKREGFWEYDVEINPGQSFFKRRLLPTWKDMNDYNACFRIKGLATKIDEYPEYEYPTEETTTSQIITTKAPVETTNITTTVNPTITPTINPTESKALETTKKVVSAKKVKLTSVKARKGCKAILRWKKVNGVSGYQIRYSTYKSFKKRVKKVKVKGPKKCKRTIAKLKAKKKYYFQVRAFTNYQNSDGSNKVVYGKWSNKKKIKSKK